MTLPASKLINHVSDSSKIDEILVYCRKNEIGEYEPFRVNGEFVFADLALALKFHFHSELKGGKFINAKNFFDVIHIDLKGL